jgi:DNA-binding transcriptional LysR family regulator
MPAIPGLNPTDLLIFYTVAKEKSLSSAAEVGNMMWTKTMVENDKGLSFTIKRDIEHELSEGRFKLVPLKEHLQITAEAVTRSDISNPIIQKFIVMVKKAFDYVD